MGDISDFLPKRAGRTRVQEGVQILDTDFTRSPVVRIRLDRLFLEPSGPQYVLGSQVFFEYANTPDNAISSTPRLARYGIDKLPFSDVAKTLGDGL